MTNSEDARNASKNTPRNAARRGFLRFSLAAGVIGLFPTMASSPSAGAAGFLPGRRAKLPPKAAQADAAGLGEWAIYKSRYVQPDGRVVDTGNGGTSHTEGQGYGMLFAVWANDRATFERMANWTQAHLSRSYDALHAWRYDPRRAQPVADQNSATDGELLMALAMLRAAELWGDRSWQDRALSIGRSVIAASTREIGGRLFLAPGTAGFDRAGKIIVNPSYYIFPAIRALGAASSDPRWTRLEQDGLWLLEQARFGRNDLPADWVEVDAQANVTPAQGWPARFSWDAVRVPLNLAWAGETDAPALVASNRFWNVTARSSFPAWTDLNSGAPAPYAANAGVVAVATLGAMSQGRLPAGADMPGQRLATDYYSASLALLARIASQEAVNHTTPMQVRSLHVAGL